MKPVPMLLIVLRQRSIQWGRGLLWSHASLSLIPLGFYRPFAMMHYYASLDHGRGILEEHCL